MSILAKVCCSTKDESLVENYELQIENEGQAKAAAKTLIKDLNKENNGKYTLMEIINK